MWSVNYQCQWSAIDQILFLMIVFTPNGIGRCGARTTINIVRSCNIPMDRVVIQNTFILKEFIFFNPTDKKVTPPPPPGYEMGGPYGFLVFTNYINSHFVVIWRLIWNRTIAIAYAHSPFSRGARSVYCDFGAMQYVTTHILINGNSAWNFHLLKFHFNILEYV